MILEPHTRRVHDISRPIEPPCLKHGAAPRCPCLVFTSSVAGRKPDFKLELRCDADRLPPVPTPLSTQRRLPVQGVQTRAMAGAGRTKGLHVDVATQSTLWDETQD